MFSAPPQTSSPWGQKNEAAPDAARVGGASGAGAGAGPGLSSWLQTQSSPGPGFAVSGAAAPGLAQAGAPSQAMASPAQSTLSWGAQTATPQAPSATAPMSFSPHQFASSGQEFLPAQQSPMQTGRAPVQYLPGYLSKMRNSDRGNPPGNRTAEPTSPPMSWEGDTSLTMTSKDAPVGARAGHAASPPTNRFSSSFFNAGADGARFSRVSSSPSMGVREGSVFGHGGLRGTRKHSEDPDRSLSLRPPTSPPMGAAHANESLSLAADAMDDDDAPPIDALADVTQPVSAFGAPATARVDTDAVTKQTPGISASLEQRTVLVYGIPAFLRTLVVERFASIGGLLATDEVHFGDLQALADAALREGGRTLPLVLRLTFSEPFQAFLAVRLSGEVVAQACIIGARWESDAMHQLSLVKGLDAPIMARHHDGIRDVPNVADAAPATPGRSPAAWSSVHGKRAASLANSTDRRHGASPLIGRPISMVDTPVAALARQKESAVSSPLRTVVHAGESLWRQSFGASHAASSPGATPQSSTTPGQPAGVIGRIADSLFGW
ncbi:hypothetical protein MSPP1_001528 [Malassezia sp. CBS 17886]|nr:hypothetical protein MSPP1_001528 [Malassezia sp. CBS 17886]